MSPRRRAALIREQHHRELRARGERFPTVEERKHRRREALAARRQARFEAFNAARGIDPNMPADERRRLLRREAMRRYRIRRREEQRVARFEEAERREAEKQMALRRAAFEEVAAQRSGIEQKLMNFVPKPDGSWVEQWHATPPKSPHEYSRIEAARASETRRRVLEAEAEAERQRWLQERRPGRR